jgi:hypothetical protein
MQLATAAAVLLQTTATIAVRAAAERHCWQQSWALARVCLPCGQLQQQQQAQQRQQQQLQLKASLPG